MAKVFYTEKDIEDLVRRGILTLEVNDNVALTDLAYEKANRLGVRLVQAKPENPPAAPVRPYLAQPGAKSAASPQPPHQAAPATPSPDRSDLHQRIRSAVIARLGNQVDAALLDTIIQRVLASTGVK